MQSPTRSRPLAVLLSLILLAVLALSACSAAATPAANYAYDSKTTAGSAPAAPPMPAEAPAAGRASTSSESAADVNAADVQRMVIKNARMALVVTDPQKSMDAISKMADTLGGFVVNASLTQSVLEDGTKVPHGAITIRVPAPKLNDALAAIRSQSDRPAVNESIDSQDVTAEYTDLQSRLRNLQNAEKDLTSIMDRATKTEDVMSVYNQLVQIREQIEVLQGKIKYYEQSAALSSVAVDLTAQAAVVPLSVAGWQPVGVARDALQATLNGLRGLVNLAIWVVLFVLPVLLVFLLVFVLPLRFLWRLWRRRNPVSQPPVAPAPPAQS